MKTQEDKHQGQRQNRVERSFVNNFRSWARYSQEAGCWRKREMKIERSKLASLFSTSPSSSLPSLLSGSIIFSASSSVSRFFYHLLTLLNPFNAHPPHHLRWAQSIMHLVLIFLPRLSSSSVVFSSVSFFSSQASSFAVVLLLIIHNHLPRPSAILLYHCHSHPPRRFRHLCSLSWLW
jgi:hypothetical protein